MLFEAVLDACLVGVITGPNTIPRGTLKPLLPLPEADCDGASGPVTGTGGGLVIDSPPFEGPLDFLGEGAPKAGKDVSETSALPDARQGELGFRVGVFVGVVGGPRELGGVEATGKCCSLEVFLTTYFGADASAIRAFISVLSGRGGE